MKSQDPYQTLSQDLPEALLLLSPEGRVQFANSGSEGLFGIASESLIGRPLDDLFPQDSSAALKALLSQAEHAPSRSPDLKLPGDGQAELWVQISLKPRRSENKKLSGFVALVIDMTLRKKIEAELQNSKESYQRVLETTAEGICQIDSGRRIVLANRRMAELLGYQNESELLGRHLHEFITEDEMEHLNEEQARRRRGEVSHYDLKYRRKDGDPVWLAVSSAPIFDRIGSYIGALGMHTDVTKRKETEDLLKQQKTFLEAIVHSCTDGIYAFDRDLRYTAWNPAMERISGKKAETRLGKYLIEVNPALRTSGIEKVLLRVLQGETIQLTNTALPCPDGSIGYFDGHYTPLLGEDGEIQGGLAMIHDVTERNQAEKLLSEQREKLILSSKMSALGEMAGGIAHEINNPLTIIHGRAHQLRMLANAAGDLDLKKVEAIGAKIESTALRISQIIKALRAIARDGESDPFEHTTVLSIIEDTLELCRARFKDHGIELRVDTIDMDLSLDCRAVQISQVLLNLLNNSFDAIETSDPKWVAIEVRDLESQIELSVTDSGPGIETEIRDKIMQPFFTTKEVGKGIGLGLGVSTGIVNSHQGTLFLDTECPNTRFVVRLPKTQRMAFSSRS